MMIGERLRRVREGKVEAERRERVGKTEERCRLGLEGWGLGQTLENISVQEQP